MTIADLGHEEPTLLLTNQLTRSACHLIGRYAQRMLIENNIEDGIDFFHMDALSSAVAMKVNCDLQLTLDGQQPVSPAGGPRRQWLRDRQVPSSVPGLDQRLGGRSRSPTRRSWCKFQKRAHNPLLIAAGFDQTEVAVPWLGGKRLRLRLRIASSCHLGRAWCKVPN